MKYTKQEIKEAHDKLAELLKPGDDVWTKVTHVARSGMSRSIEVYLIRDNEPWNISYMVARALDYGMDDRWGGLRVGGCGMDMTFHIVYSLGRHLWPNGVPCAGDKCRSNAHFNDWEGPRGEGVVHSDGGYALNNRNL